MRCPFCANPDTQVKDSRSAEDGTAIRRRRHCPKCGARFTTFERVQLKELTVVKRSGRKQPFMREKLMKSIDIACQKRELETEKIDQMVSGIISQLEKLTDGEVQSREIGALVMEGLANLDQVAFVRYASVYQDFQTPADFSRFLAAEKLADGASTGVDAPNALADRE